MPASSRSRSLRTHQPERRHGFPHETAQTSRRSNHRELETKVVTPAQGQGSWNRTVKVGGDVLAIKMNDDGTFRSMEPFLTGFIQNNNYVGRPVGILDFLVKTMREYKSNQRPGDRRDLATTL